jgi:hypothetical protein
MHFIFEMFYFLLLYFTSGSSKSDEFINFILTPWHTWSYLFMWPRSWTATVNCVGLFVCPFNALFNRREALRLLLTYHSCSPSTHGRLEMSYYRPPRLTLRWPYLQRLASFLYHRSWGDELDNGQKCPASAVPFINIVPDVWLRTILHAWSLLSVLCILWISNVISLCI